MSTQSTELMKQLIEAKKNKPHKQQSLKPNANAPGFTERGFNNKKRGGAFDK